MQPGRALNTSRNSILKQGHKTSFVLFSLLSLSSTHLFTPTPPHPNLSLAQFGGVCIKGPGPSCSTRCYMMILGSGTDSLMDLWGRTLAPFRYSSSFTITSSPKTVTFSIRTWGCRWTQRHCVILSTTIITQLRVKEAGDWSYTHPLANRGAPAHDAALQPWMWSHSCALHHSAAFYPHPILHNHTSTDADIWSDGAVFPDLGCWVLQRESGSEDCWGDAVLLFPYLKCCTKELNPPQEHCRETQVQCVACRELVVVLTEGTYTCLSGSLLAGRCPSRNLHREQRLAQRQQLETGMLNRAYLSKGAVQRQEVTMVGHFTSLPTCRVFLSFHTMFHTNNNLKNGTGDPCCDWKC